MRNMSNNDVTQYIVESVIVYKNECVYATGVDGNNRRLYVLFPNGKEESVSLEDDMFYIRALPCMYYDNGQGGFSFMERYPQRQWKYGMSGRNSSVNRFGSMGMLSELLRINRAYRDDYPTLQRALVLLQRKQMSSVGLSKRFCLTASHLLFNEARVARFDLKSSSPLLFEKGFEEMASLFSKEIR